MQLWYAFVSCLGIIQALLVEVDVIVAAEPTVTRTY